VSLGSGPAELEWLCISREAEPWGLGVWADATGYPDAAWTQAASIWAKTHEVPPPG
jgi:hypothetical protein